MRVIRVTIWGEGIRFIHSDAVLECAMGLFDIFRQFKRKPTFGFLLVLQLRGETSEDFDVMVQMEERLRVALGTSVDVDGNDFGGGLGNIFIYTSEPSNTFLRIRSLLQESNQLQDVIAAYRPVDSDDFVQLWPEDGSLEFCPM